MTSAATTGDVGEDESHRGGAPNPTTCRFLVRLRRHTELQAHVIQALCEEARRGPESLRPCCLRGWLWPRHRGRVGYMCGVSCTSANRPSTDRLFRHLVHRVGPRGGVRRPGDIDRPHRFGGEFAPLAPQERSRALTEGEYYDFGELAFFKVAASRRPTPKPTGFSGDSGRLDCLS